MKNEIITEKDFTPQTPSPRPQIVKFVNFSKQPFTWTWNKVPYTFLPSTGNDGNEKYMERSLALHFAKHLVNRELTARGRENDTSPKNPDENPFFMELFNRCVIEVDADQGPTDQTKLEQEAIDRNMKAQASKNKPATARNAAKTTGKPAKTTRTATSAVKTAKNAPVAPSPEELALMTGQSEHHPKITNKPASEADKDFEIIEPPADDDDE